jgi:hypothetical protein
MVRRMSLEQLPARPFDLSGTWSFQDGQEVKITQSNGEIALQTRPDGPFFRARYTSNPVIEGEGRSTLTVMDPDVIQWDGKVIFRSSNPRSHDVACDEEDTSHVRAYYARLRGLVAYNEKDYKAVRCWLKIGADWGYAPAQSMLAALIIDAKDGTAPDYALAFDLASKSAMEGDVAGQYQLAAMFRDGKGTDPIPRSPGSGWKARNIWLNPPN